MTTNIESIEKLFHDWRESVPRCAKAKGDYIYLTEFRKSKKAMLMIQAEREGIKTGQQRESYAYSHKEYIELLEGLKVAVEVYEDLRHRMVIAKYRVEAWRSQNATNNAELKFTT